MTALFYWAVGDLVGPLHFPMLTGGSVDPPDTEATTLLGLTKEPRPVNL